MLLEQTTATFRSDTNMFNLQLGRSSLLGRFSAKTFRPEPGDVLGEPVGQADAGLSDIVQLLEVAEPVDHKPRPEPNKCFADFLFYFVFPLSGDAKPNLFQ